MVDIDSLNNYNIISNLRQQEGENMSGRIVINVMLECELTDTIQQLYDTQGDKGLNSFARSELQALLEGDEPTVDWMAQLLAITIKKE